MSAQNKIYASGNLQSRTHGANTESFGYDALNRLTDITYTGQTSNIDYTADNSGNIHTKYDAGTYSYDPDKVHAVTDIEGDNDIPSFDQNITYTAFNKVEQISEGPYTLDFTYGLDRARKKTVLKENGLPVLRKYFFGSYEIREDLQDGTVYEYHFLPGGAIYRTENGMGEMLYTYSDYLGSITHVTDETGNLIHEQSFGAWGRERDPDTYEYTNVQTHGRASLLNDRGYTGHEMLPQFGLINMNGRLYDPILGRMLSPDPYIQMPDYSQNFNRYSYVLNNPLKFTDPSGEFVWIPVAIGAVLGAYSGYKIAEANGYNFSDGQTYGYMFGGAVIGGLSGYIGAGIAASGGIMANTVSIVGSSYFNSVGMSAISGGMTDVNVGFGIGSYNFDQNELSGVWTWGQNSTMENIAYTVGALTNIQDGFAGFNGRSDIKVTGSIDKGMGHAMVEGTNPELDEVYISVVDAGGRNTLPLPGDTKIFPDGMQSTTKFARWGANKEYMYMKYIGKTVKGSNSGDMHGFPLSITLNNVRGSTLETISRYYRKGWNHNASRTLRYGWGEWKNRAYFLGSGCIAHARGALFRAGIPTLPLIWPISLPLELYARQSIIYASPFIINGQ